MQTYLITGGAGFIGANLIAKLIENNRIICIDNFNDYYSPTIKENNIKKFVNNKNFKLFKEDVCNIKGLDNIFKKNTPDYIIHLAAKAGVRDTTSPHAYINSNITGTVNILEMAKKYNVNLEVLSSLEKKPGTKVKEVIPVEKMLIRGVTRDNNVARIAVIGLPDKPGIAFKVFSLMSKNNINVDIILQSIGRDGTKDISFTVSSDHKDLAVKVLEENKQALEAQAIELNDNVCKLSIVGAGMQTNAGVATTMFEALFEAGININMISTSEIKISVLIDKEESEKALRVVHDAFLG